MGEPTDERTGDLFFELDSEWKAFFGSHGLSEVALLGALSQSTSQNSVWQKHLKAFKSWLTQKRHGEMTYLENNWHLREQPSGLLAEHQSTFVFLIPYNVGRLVRGNKGAVSDSAHEVLRGQPKRGADPGSWRERIARYARHKDYHKVIRRRLTEVFNELVQQAGSTGSDKARFRIVIDSAPFLDRAHAHLSGLGFIGRNTMLIRPQLGSYFFIASVLTSLPPLTFGHRVLRPIGSFGELTCATCTRCVEACPTGALKGDYTMDATRCISYLNIEKRGAPDLQKLNVFRDWSFGCDICQEVCPYNHRTLDGRNWDEFLVEAPTLSLLSVYDVATMTRVDYERWFGGLPLTRAKYEGLVRNALCSLIAMNDEGAFERAMILWRDRRQNGYLIGQNLEEILSVLESALKVTNEQQLKF